MWLHSIGHNWLKVFFTLESTRQLASLAAIVAPFPVATSIVDARRKWSAQINPMVEANMGEHMILSSVTST